MEKAKSVKGDPAKPKNFLVSLCELRLKRGLDPFQEILFNHLCEVCGVVRGIKRSLLDQAKDISVARVNLALDNAVIKAQEHGASTNSLKAAIIATAIKESPAYNPDQALDFSRKTKTRWRGLESAPVYWALAYYAKDDFEKAGQELDSFVRNDIENFPALFLQGMIHQKNGNFSAMYDSFRRAVKVEPRNRLGRYLYAEACYRYAEIKMENRQTADASDLYAEAGIILQRMDEEYDEESSRDARSIMLYGRVLKRQRKDAAAHAMYEKAVVVEPNNHQYRKVLAASHMTRSEYKEALKHFEHAVKISTKNTDKATYHACAAQCCTVLAKEDEADQHIKAAALLESRNMTLKQVLIGRGVQSPESYINDLVLSAELTNRMTKKGDRQS